jgi:hypothetical protein
MILSKHPSYTDFVFQLDWSISLCTEVEVEIQKLVRDDLIQQFLSNGCIPKVWLCVNNTYYPTKGGTLRNYPTFYQHSKKIVPNSGMEFVWGIYYPVSNLTSGGNAKGYFQYLSKDEARTQWNSFPNMKLLWSTENDEKLKFFTDPDNATKVSTP